MIIEIQSCHSMEEEIMRKKSWLATATIMALALSLAGCGQQPQTSASGTSAALAQSQSQSQSQNPALTQPQTDSTGAASSTSSNSNSSSSASSSSQSAADTSAQGDPATQKVVESKINDWLAKNYPGDWKVSGKTLSKGNYTENGNYKMVDGIEELFPGTMGVSIFVGENRISSSVKEGTERVLDGYPTPSTVGDVEKSGKSTSSLDSGFLKVYVPFQAQGKTVAVLTVSVPHQ